MTLPKITIIVEPLRVPAIMGSDGIEVPGSYVLTGSCVHKGALISTSQSPIEVDPATVAGRQSLAEEVRRATLAILAELQP
jgi:hypothetical protein